MERATRLNPDESRALTGLRGCGAALVVAHHCYLRVASGFNPPFSGLLQRGYLGVDLFFVLSGFVLSLVYGSWFDGSMPGRLSRMLAFMVRRVARLWPLHATVLLIILAARCCGFGEDVTAHTLMTNFTMTQAWGVSRSINVPTWSISTEFLVYLLFPALAAPLLRSRFGLPGGLGAVLILLGAAIYLGPPYDHARRGLLDLYHNYSLLPVVRSLAGFILGMVAWRAGGTRLRNVFTNAWTGPAALLMAVVFMMAGVSDLVIYALLPIIILGMHFGTGPMVGLLKHGPIHGLGVLSYAIYLIHFALLDHFPFGWGNMGLELALFAAGVLVLAALAHVAVERPGRRLIGQLDKADPAPTAPLPPLQRAPR